MKLLIKIYKSDSAMAILFKFHVNSVKTGDCFLKVSDLNFSNELIEYFVKC